MAIFLLNTCCFVSLTLANCERKTCGIGQCECDDGECIQADWFCDNQFPPDCKDGSDELRCCADTQFNCANGRCIALDKQCDGQFDCRGDKTNSDELDCPGKIMFKSFKALLCSQIPIAKNASYLYSENPGYFYI